LTVFCGQTGAQIGDRDIGMLQNDLTNQAPVDSDEQPSRIGDLSAMLRMMHPLKGSLPDETVGRQRLLADLCRFIGVKVGSLPPESLGFPPAPLKSPSQSKVNSPEQVTPNAIELSRRMEQTLLHLLNGDSEKQVARKLQLSPHTVHGYVKALYRRFGVSSRGELLAKQLRK
jgi:DNA-binding CsgD family transcriptional regulator